MTPENTQRLIEWYKARLINRFDVYGLYHPANPPGQLWKPVWGDPPARGIALTDDVLAKHVHGEINVATYDSGAPGSPREGCSLFGSVDVDDGWETAQRISGELTAVGYKPIIERTDDANCYHVWTLFEKPSGIGDIHELLLKIVGNKLIIFPREQPRIRTSGARLPGRNPKNGAWSQLWNGTRLIEWGDEFVDEIVKYEGGPWLGMSRRFLRLPAHFIKPHGASMLRRKKRKPEPEGCGTELKRLFKNELGITACSGCNKTMKCMNQLGPQGCRENIDEIVRQIKVNKKTASIDWAAQFSAMGKAARMGLFSLEAIVLEAVDRYEKRTSAA